jgi:hypothetical protein
MELAFFEKTLKFTPPGTRLAPSGALVLGLTIVGAILHRSSSGVGR